MAATISQNQQISLIVVQICILFVLGASNKSHGPILKFQCDGFVQDGHHKRSNQEIKLIEGYKVFWFDVASLKLRAPIIPSVCHIYHFYILKPTFKKILRKV